MTGSMHLFQLIQFPDRPRVSAANSAPQVAVIHGFLGRAFLRDHLLHYLRAGGTANATMYGHMHTASGIADELAAAHADGRAIAIIGYSLGGFQAVKVARELERRDVPLPLLATIGAGGPGRLVPTQWFAEHRHIPANVGLCLNYFSESDRLGLDREYGRNLAVAEGSGQQVVNHVFPKNEGVGHMDLVRCYPDARVHAQVRTQLLARLERELAILNVETSLMGGRSAGSERRATELFGNLERGMSS
jgi:hypothetical protein